MAKQVRLTLKMLADELGLSTCTVSRVLNGKGQQYRIAEKTMQRVLEHAHERGFSPNLVARGLRMKQTQAVGLVLPDLSNTFFAKIARSVANVANQNKFTLEVCDSQDSIDLEIEVLSLLRNRQVDGLIICPVGIDSEHLRILESGAPPAVLVDRYFPNLRLPYVASDNAGGAEAATRHLVEHGHRKIVCLQGLPNTITNVHRLDGFRRVLQVNKIRFRNYMIAGGGFTIESGYQATRKLLEQGHSFTALLTLNNLIALGALKALHEARLNVPEDVSLVTFDTIEGVDFFSSPLTTVSQSPRKIGERAAIMLFDLIYDRGGQDRGGQAVEQIHLPTRLTNRQSVRKLPV